MSEKYKLFEKGKYAPMFDKVEGRRERSEMEKRRRLTVARIEVEEDRILFYDEDSETPDVWHYRVIAEPDEAKDVIVGDEIEYQPEGANFGWFKGKVNP